MHVPTLLQMICNYNSNCRNELRYFGQMAHFSRSFAFLPSRSDFAREHWRADFLAGIAVAVVALPLALGFGIATGTGAASGIAAAIVAGFIAALFVRSRFEVSRATGTVTVVLAPIA